MGLKIASSGPTEADGRRWYPDFLDNLDKKEEDRAGFVIAQLSGREIERIERANQKVKVKTKAKGTERLIAQISAQQRATRNSVFDTKIVSLFGWQKEDGGEYTAWKDLHDAVMANPAYGIASRAMFDDLYAEITGGSQLAEAVEGE